MKFLNLSGLKEKGIVYSMPTIRKLEEAGQFPARVWLSKRKAGWIESQIDSYLQKLAKQSDGQTEKARRAAQKAA
ncbi:AlpA family transcriptional regulator [Bradyrhizobium sp. JYMT SZCCT0428]|uniref:helix-turn-helix transcriptional regulator n=1 Tax=Bradyrhizobium sp. JYMT SZCCT0428 TaxID=2807673 RepID=UPI001BAADFFA|nr:AlpA family phage regulatory protein [Bradyrhizobium sp. JYMT SZCCT0428]MBR1154519.1 AlpA family phage regulatory protein [Bradyrhizobium sp. JYMT SZCCT0428]